MKTHTLPTDLDLILHFSRLKNRSLQSVQRTVGAMLQKVIALEAGVPEGQGYPYPGLEIREQQLRVAKILRAAVLDILRETGYLLSLEEE